MSEPVSLDDSPDHETSPPAARKIRVLVVDDHPVTRRGLVALINQQSDLEVCGQTDSGEEAIALTEELRPDLVTLDLVLADADGIELTRRLRESMPELRILIVSMHDETYYAEHALRAGAMGYVMKQEAPEQVIAGLQLLSRGEIFLTPSMKHRLFSRYINSRGGNPVFALDTLSDREKEVFALMGDGFSTRQIAEQLGISPKTIDSYREHLKMKLSLRSGEELVRHAILSRTSQTRLGTSCAQLSSPGMAGHS